MWNSVSLLHILEKSYKYEGIVNYSFNLLLKDNFSFELQCPQEAP
jgi:hypothetical protein